MSDIDSVLTRVKQTFSKYVDAGLVDETIMYYDAITALKRFGNDVCVLQDVVIDVKNGKAKLPDNFFSLFAAYLCDPLAYENSGVDIPTLQQSYFYTEKTSLNTSWNECDSCCSKDKEETLIRENLYFDSGKVTFYYQNPRLLRLGKTFIKSKCHSKCRNKVQQDCLEEINIYKTMLTTNFNEGSVYMKYYGLPLDEEGNIDMPETKNENVSLFLEYYLKERISEDLIINKDAQGVQSLYGTFAGKAQMYQRAASAELKFSKLNPKSLRRIERLNKLQSLTFELNSPAWL